MAKLPSIKKLVIEDFPAQVKQWIETLIQPLNQFMDSVNGALNRGLTFGENLDAQIANVEVVDTSLPVSFKVTTRARPVGCWPVSLRVSATGAAASTPAITWDYSPVKGSIELSAVSGLTTGVKYTLTLAIITG